MDLLRVLAAVAFVVVGCAGSPPTATPSVPASSPIGTVAPTPAAVAASPTMPATSTPAATVSGTPEAPARGVVALGHSALTGEGSDPARPGQEARENSWATGTNPEVNSIYQRLVALRPEAEGQVANSAEAGAPASRLAGQARTALASLPGPQLVIIQTIDGDIRCDGTDDRHVPEFGTALTAALEAITEASPESRVLILSQAGRPATEAEALTDEPEIRRSFGGTGMCDFFDPNGDLVPDRLSTLTAIIEQYEAEQVRVCSMFPQCSTDDGLMTTYVREQEHVVEGDWNHLGVRGQAAIAELVWPLVANLLGLNEPTAVASPTPPSTAPPPTCPNPHGGVCLGPLEAGTYTTRLFKTPLTYTVPDGWANYEDLPGNFLLVPPSGSLDGVDAGTSDYIGVYDGVAPASADCQERAEPGVALTPEAMSAWYASHPGLAVEGPEPVTVGGLDGVVLDLAMAEGETGVCRFPDFEGRVVPVLIGAGPGELAHALIEGLVMRLYLLSAPTGEVIAIEIDDLPGGDTMESMVDVVEDFQFGADAP